MMEHLAGLLDWVSAHAAWAGPVVFLIAMMESLALVGLIMPGALLMFSFGALIGSGHLDYQPIVLWAIAGAIVGDGLSYLLGRWFGPRIWAWPLFRQRPQLLQRSIDYFRRHGGKSVVLGRFVGPLRPVVPMVAGMMHMPVWRFLGTNFLSAIVWAPAYLLPGQLLIASVDLAATVATRLSVLILVVLGLLWLAVLVIRWALRAAGRSGRVKRSLLGALVLIALSCGLAFIGSQWWSSQASIKVLSWRNWHERPWELLPLHRQGFLDSRQAFSFQLAAQPIEIARALVQDGWQLPERFDGRGALLWLSPEIDLIRMPPLPKRHAGNAPAMVFVRHHDGDRLIFRAWRSDVALSTGHRPIWLVTVERVELKPGWPWAQQRELQVPAQVLAQLRTALERHLPPGSLLSYPG